MNKMNNKKMVVICLLTPVSLLLTGAQVQAGSKNVYAPTTAGIVVVNADSTDVGFNTIVTTIPVGGLATGMCFNAPNTRAFVVVGATVTVLDIQPGSGTENQIISGGFSLPTSGNGCALNPNDSVFYVALNDGTVKAFNSTTGALLATSPSLNLGGFFMFSTPRHVGHDMKTPSDRTP